MAFKFPFTNYHELNLTWVLDQLKKLFEESAENVSVIETYNGRLTAVETELPAVSENAAEAARSASAAASLAQTAKGTADTARENAIQAQRDAGTAQNTAERAQEAADAATQAAQQAQATAQNFDGRITQAQNDAASALEASRSFENRVQAAITTANNAANTSTIAQNKAEAAQTAAENADGKAEAAQTAAENADGKAEDALTAAINIASSLAPVEETATASRSYAVNDLLIYNNILYKVVSAIAAGGVLTPGTNITTTTVDTELDDKQEAPATAFYNALPLRLILPKRMQSPNYSSRSILVTYNKIVLSWTGSNNQNSAKISVKSGRGTYQNLSSETLSEMQVDDFFVLPRELKTTLFSIKILYLPDNSTGNGMNLYFCYANIVDNKITVKHTHRTSLGSSIFSMYGWTIPMYSDSTHLAIFIGTGGSYRRGTIYLWTELNT